MDYVERGDLVGLSKMPLSSMPSDILRNISIELPIAFAKLLARDDILTLLEATKVFGGCVISAIRGTPNPKFDQKSLDRMIEMEKGSEEEESIKLGGQRAIDGLESLDVIHPLVIRLAARYGDTEVLEWAITNRKKLYGGESPSPFIGHTDELHKAKYSHLLDYKSIYDDAIIGGHLSCLKVLRRPLSHVMKPLPKKRYSLLGPSWKDRKEWEEKKQLYEMELKHWNANPYHNRPVSLLFMSNPEVTAALYGQLEILKWLYEHERSYDAWDSIKHLPVTREFNFKDCYDSAAIGGHLDVLNWLFSVTERVSAHGPHLYSSATRSDSPNRLEVLNWLKTHDINFYKGDVDSVIYWHKLGRMPTDQKDEVLKWMRENADHHIPSLH